MIWLLRWEVRLRQDSLLYLRSLLSFLPRKAIDHSEGRWLPWVSGYDINDFYNGYAGNHTPVDAIQVYYYTPDNVRPYQQALYRVSELRKNYFAWQEDTSTNNNMDGYAGNASGIAIDRVQIQIRENK